MRANAELQRALVFLGTWQILFSESGRMLYSVLKVLPFLFAYKLIKIAGYTTIQFCECTLNRATTQRSNDRPAYASGILATMLSIRSGHRCRDTDP